MPTFKYHAKSFSGKISQGLVEAENESEARMKIRTKKLIPIKLAIGYATRNSSKEEAVKSKGMALRFSKVKTKDLQIFTRQLSVLITSGIPLLQALETLSQSKRSYVMDKALKQIVTDISGGKKLGEAFRAHPNVFNNFYVNMLVAGEEGGILDRVLLRMSIHIEKTAKLQQKIKGAAVYPVVVLFISLAVITGLLVFVIPKFVTMFEGSGQDLPYLTQVTIAMSEFVRTEWHILLFCLIALAASSRIYVHTKEGKDRFHGLLVRAPVFGNFIVKSSMAKFSRTLSSLLSAGVPIIDALTIASSTVGNSVIKRILEEGKVAVAKGKQLSACLGKTKIIPHMVVQMIAVGEGTGALDEMLSKVADFYEDEVDTAVGSITSLMEPVLIVFLGGIIAFFVIAMYLPVFNMAGAI